MNRSNPTEINSKEDYAKAADRLIKFRGFDGAFVFGYVSKDDVHVSARSNKIDVGKILKEIGGGGNPQSAGGRFKTDNIFNLEQKLMDSVPIGISQEENIIEEPKIVLVKQKIKRKK